MSTDWHNQQIAAANQGKIGLIDIGSNSIRLVVYDRLKRAPYSIYNEKVMCQLGKGLAISGKLNPNGVDMAKIAIARFVALAKNMEVTELDVIATAAVREASDGPDFVDTLEQEHHLFVEVISGKREAKLGAYGVLSSMYQPEGLVADLGGGSLELVPLDSNQHISERVSLPIGALRLLDECDSHDAIRNHVQKTLTNEPWLENQVESSIYAVGGSFRNLARMHMMATHYPLPLVHHYTIGTDDMQSLLQQVITTDPETLATMPGVSNKRLTILPAAAIVLDELMQIVNPSAITFSGSGIREGYVYEKLSPFIRTEDPLVAACIDMVGKMNHSLAYANELFEWMQDILKKQSESSKRLAYAFCLLQDIARYIHADDRAAWIFHHIIRSNLQGLNHKQRVQLALTLYYRYGYKLKHDLAELMLLDEKSHHWARLVGTIGSLAHHLTGGVAGSLPHIVLTMNKQHSELTLPESMQALDGHVIEKRITSIHEFYHAWRKF